MSTTASPKKFQFLPFLISLLITLAIGFGASLFTRPQISGWYSTLNKPSFNPPDWLFAPVWTTLYVMIAIAAYLVWKRRDNSRAYSVTVIIYTIQLALNFSWSIMFFGLHGTFPALIIILLLWISIILNIRWFHKFNHTAAWLLAPYLLWVSFAGLLNLSIYLLNWRLKNVFLLHLFYLRWGNTYCFFASLPYQQAFRLLILSTLNILWSRKILLLKVKLQL